MNLPALEAGPKVFISYASNDGDQAERLAADLEARGIRVFFAPEAIVPGTNVPLALSQALADSDYFVLLVSASSVDRPWVDLEWSAALEREIRERRAFLFVLRLDNTPPPAILASRLRLDAFVDWDSAVERLSRLWLRIRAEQREGIVVLPAPEHMAVHTTHASPLDLYVFNRSLGVKHFLQVPPDITGEQLEARVRTALALPERQEALGGKVGLSFGYRLEYDGTVLRSTEPITSAGVKHGTSIDITVIVEMFGPGQAPAPVDFRAPEARRHAPPGLYLGLFRRAFAHLMPRQS
ncbi:MAG TPA: toll/interleukin-1 receptor domain-containing protein [Thermoanaerobaculia bacterium]|nr:toll/interleukin-1 receptor domain-containing protein [Thermoanaerobaculia bacterium]